MALRLQSAPKLPLAIFLVLLGAAALAGWIAPHDPGQQDLFARLTPPVWLAGGRWRYLLGTDGLGRDIASNVLYGLRVSLLVGFVSVAISVALGATSGLIAGYRSGGWFDTVVMPLVDLQLSIPAVLIALAVMAVSGRGLWKLILVIGIVGWAPYARLMRASVLAERGRDYITAARLIGASEARVLFRHLLPNVLSALLVQASVDVPRAVELEASLSFLGLGVAVTTPSLGLRVAQGYQYLFGGAWWPSVVPGLALVLLVLAENLIGDWARDALDPHFLARGAPAGAPAGTPAGTLAGK